MGAQKTTLRRPSRHFTSRYLKLRGGLLQDTSVAGGIDLLALGRSAPPGGVVGVPLHDGREFHLSAGAALAGRPYRIMAADRCCEDGTDRLTCARSVLSSLDRAGARVVLPTPANSGHLPRKHDAWLQAMRQALSEKGTVETQSHWWVTWHGSGGGGTLPCRAGPT
jgi:hypothetical protein